jgi:hypothetical protein
MSGNPESLRQKEMTLEIKNVYQTEKFFSFE